MSTISFSGLVSTELERSEEVLQQMYTFTEEVIENNAIMYTVIEVFLCR